MACLPIGVFRLRETDRLLRSETSPPSARDSALESGRHRIDLSESYGSAIAALRKDRGLPLASPKVRLMTPIPMPELP